MIAPDLVKIIREYAVSDAVNAYAKILARDVADFRRNGREVYTRCPFHNDHHPSFRVNPSNGLWRCDPCSVGGDLIDLAGRLTGRNTRNDFPELVEILGEYLGVDSGAATTNGAARSDERSSARTTKTGSDPGEVMDVGQVTDSQIAALIGSRRIKQRETLERVGARLVRYRGAEWLGLPTIASTWKLIAVDGLGRSRLDAKGKLARVNIGHVSIIASRELRKVNGAGVRRLFDVEGESDLLALLDAGAPAAISSSAPASNAAHENARAWLEALHVHEVVVVRDLDDVGRKSATAAAKWWGGLGATVRVLELPSELGEKGDVRDFLLGRQENDSEPRKALGTFADLERLADATRVLAPVDPGEARLRSDEHGAAPGGPPQLPPLRVVSFEELVALELPPREFLLEPILKAKGLYMVFAKRGIGKSYFVLGIAVAVATGGTFLGWRAPRPRRVLLFDGELPADMLKRRFLEVVRGAEGDVLANPDFLRLVSYDLQERALPDFADPVSRFEIERVVEESGAELVILDNVSCLCRSGIENAAEDWAPMQELLLSLRRQGRTVIFLHHAGRNNEARGSSKREDILDNSIRLSHPTDYSDEQGLRAVVEFTKARELHGEGARSLEIAIEVRDGQAIWTYRTLDDADLLRVAALVNEGISYRDIAKELQLHRSKVERLKKRADARGLLK